MSRLGCVGFPRCPSLGVADDSCLSRRSVKDQPELRVGVDDRELAEPIVELGQHHPARTSCPLEPLVERLLRELLRGALRNRLDAPGSRGDRLLEHHPAELLPTTRELGRVGMHDAQAGVDDHERVRTTDRPGLHRHLDWLEQVGHRIRPTQLDLHRPLRPARHGSDLSRKRPYFDRRARSAGNFVAAEPHLQCPSVQLGLLAVQVVELPLVVGERVDQQSAAVADRAVFGLLASTVDDGGIDTKAGRKAVAYLPDASGTAGHRRLRRLDVHRFVLHAFIVSWTTDILCMASHFAWKI
ncbi:hypothetical protein C5B85_17605 [Pseudoclavibacter sp. AY1F1]|nr:hypothetical protein C5B85_17605 [Pseudoclavibacter sp. AY1F1]